MSQKLQKLFWTWDHSTNWTLNVPGNQSCGAGNTYTKKPGTFLSDYQRSIDYCVDHGIDAIGIAGLLRERHGGVNFARKVCAYARERGVRIYMIAGLYAYGGVFYEGEHPYCLETFLRDNPDCLAKNTDGKDLLFQCQAPGCKLVRQGCPSNPKMNDYVLRSIEWLFKNVPELGGLQMETGDTKFCMCPKCLERRKMGEIKPEIDYWMSFDDMALIYPDAVKIMQQTAPEAWAICETYHHFLPGDPNTLYDFGGDLPSDKAELFRNIPKNTFLQWVCDHPVLDGVWKEDYDGKLPEILKPFRHILRAHQGTYWSGGRHALALERVRRQCRMAALCGAEAVSMFGESSPFHTNMEFNYLALTYFADNPFSTPEQFADDVMAPRLGGKQLAEDYIKFATIGKTEPGKIPQFTGKIMEYSSKLREHEQVRRWVWLASYLNSLHWESMQKDFIQQDEKLVVS